MQERFNQKYMDWAKGGMDVPAEEHWPQFFAQPDVQQIFDDALRQNLRFSEASVRQFLEGAEIKENYWEERGFYARTNKEREEAEMNQRYWRAYRTEKGAAEGPLEARPLEYQLYEELSPRQPPGEVDSQFERWKREQFKKAQKRRGK
jgi:hypothetical protein